MRLFGAPACEMEMQFRLKHSLKKKYFPGFNSGVTLVGTIHFNGLSGARAQLVDVAAIPHLNASVGHWMTIKIGTLDLF